LKEGTGDSELVPVEINNTPIPDSIKQANTVEIPDDWNNRGIVSWSKYKTK
jgi:hypothetical protein